MSHKHPYTDLPDHCFWSKAHDTGQLLDPVAIQSDQSGGSPQTAPGIQLNRDTRIATAGSCFAQHIAQHLRTSGYTVLDAEAPHPVISPEVAARFGYGVFSARYGNIYTARQLLQLVQRAGGAFCPREDRWTEPGGQLIDPFRPTVEPGGFPDAASFEADRSAHFAAVTEVMRSAEVLIFTLGLTEGWRDRDDDAIYPLAPGVAGGCFDPDRHEFVNFSVEETVADFRAFLAMVRRDNPDLRIILTVSPVPLAATARADAHVVAATSYSKTVLRVAAEQLAQGDTAITYFPSYEIITSASSRGRYFGPDHRSVERAGVRHVMKIFSRHFTTAGEDALARGAAGERQRAPSSGAHAATVRVARALDVICDEQRLEGAAR
ncbi:MAG: GSCFA domain-containing protein [Rhodobacteraceae bacterium]|nr:GSCFA domain-containing protein [Paracoccaceae bacterium]